VAAGGRAGRNDPSNAKHGRTAVKPIAPDAAAPRLARALERLAVLRDLDRAILSAGSVRDVACVALRHLRELVPVPRAAVIAYDLVRETGTVLAVDEDSTIEAAAPGAVFALRDVVPPELLTDPAPRVYPDIGADLKDLAAARLMLAHGHRAVTWVPLVVDEHLLGVMVMAAPETAAFDGDGLEIASEIAGQLAVGLRVLRERAGRDAAARRLSVLHDIDRAILDAATTEELARAVLPRVLSATGAAYARLFSYDLAARTVRLLADIRADGGPVLAAGMVAPMDRVIDPELVRHPEVHRFEQLEQGRPVAPDDPTVPRELGAHAWVPLLAGERLVGAFVLGYAGRESPSDDDLATAKEVADQLAVAMLSAESRHASARARARLELVNGISSAILGGGTPAEVAARVAGPLLGLAGAERATVVGYDLVAGTATVLAVDQVGGGAEMEPGRLFPISEVVPLGFIAERRSVVFADLPAVVDRLPAARDAVRQGFRSSVMVPLVAGETVLGHLALASRDEAVGDPENRAVAEEVAGLLALAIRDAATLEALEDREARLRVVLEGSPNGILAVDPSGAIHYANPAAAVLLGADQATLATTSLHDLVPDAARASHPERVRGWFTSADAGLSVHPLDAHARRLDGSTFPVHVLHAMASATGGPLAIVTLIDLSERIALESRLRQAERMEVLGQFASVLAHDVRNSLTAVVWLTESLSAELAPDDPRREDMVIIRQAVDDAIAMTRTTLEYARPAAVVVGATDLELHLAGARRVLARILGDHVALEIDAAPGLPPAGIDPTALTQVLVNLVSNARDAMPDGGIVRISATLHDSGSCSGSDVLRGPHLHLCIADTGVGMDEATRSHAFDAFYTTKHPGSGTGGRGSGVGLSSVWLLVTAAGGTVKLTSEPGAGTTFVVTLPIAGQFEDDTGPRAA